MGITVLIEKYVVIKSFYLLHLILWEGKQEFQSQTNEIMSGPWLFASLVSVLYTYFYFRSVDAVITSTKVVPIMVAMTI